MSKPQSDELPAGSLLCQECGHNLVCENYPSEYFRNLHCSSKNLPFGQLGDVEFVANSPTDKNGLPEYIINQGYFSRFFQVVQKLGKGAGGTVYLCRHILNDLVLGLYAVKIVPIGNDRDWLMKVLKEVRLLERLHHENIVDYKHTWIEIFQPSAFGISVPCLFILMEYANAGNLDNFIYESFSLYSSSEDSLVTASTERFRVGTARSIAYAKQIQDISIQICRGMQHLHDLSIIHHDLKPQNILLKETGNRLIVLLSDFGECEFLSAVGERNRTGGTGTLEYMAPELLISDEYGALGHSYDCSCDIWSFGIVLYNLCFGKLPFDYLDIEPADLPERIISFSESDLRFPPHDKILDSFVEIIKQCLKLNPSERPSADRLLHSLNLISFECNGERRKKNRISEFKFLLLNSVLLSLIALKICRRSYVDSFILSCILILNISFS